LYAIDRSGTILLGLIKRYGPSKVKKVLWDREFSGGKWSFIDDTEGDCVYQYLHKYLNGGSILDLGCGPGNTATELTAASYTTYVGVDISETALEKARKRSVVAGRSRQNSFAQGDFLSYTPQQQFDVILFRESLYHVPFGKVKTVLARFSQYLKPSGLFIVRMYASSPDDGKKKHRPNAMFALIDREFDVVEKRTHPTLGEPTVVVFRPKSVIPQN
jgi:2-polyprenyl-6-hydroxyphenyl methylase/3-demethylubiquinone-9 3-methyltransferase